MKVYRRRPRNLLGIRIAVVVGALVVSVAVGWFASGNFPQAGVKVGCIAAALLGSLIGLGGLAQVALSPKKPCADCPGHIHYEPNETRTMVMAMLPGGIVFVPALLYLLYDLL